MSWRFPLTVLAMAVGASPVSAQERAPEAMIQVTGTGVVETAADNATLAFWLRGEGATPDAAVSALAAKQKAVIGGLRTLLGAQARITTADVVVIEARAEQCQDGRGQPRLSDGACAVRGYVATAQGAVRTSAIDRAATAAGLASRLGASDARVTGFGLRDPAAAMRRATAAAIADARQRAETAAQGAGVKLGPMRLVRDQNLGPAESDGTREYGPPPAPMVSTAHAPIALDTRPQPVETRVQVQVSYAVLP